ncbi:carboxypeptidase-like regulatory domain-containing protein [Aureisphaera sp. CAU 1614]|uniref:Carboxypeptidase-like regulatory domain-containing protein n=1 Tax=Halomarinibacterium sedimenti TaxID=2857106 RepID=A0A9X1FNN6_9FLAO|nr:VIT domain-containing protein [Halomarinibacterium sedimenti]MBW2937553.1 carboxypeptidase-like regulatory domain-containing protein [Halomarinibacterium sedimenti]
MKNITFLLILLGGIAVKAQSTPKIMMNDSLQLQLTSLEVETNITENYAETTYYMKFYNSLDRIMEGELSFPLGEGQSVSRFAMEVSGQLREAVIVEKELARVAYESTIRQKIDPGLLEKVDGNNYKARIYPIPAKGYKEVIVSYEQPLHTQDGQKIYELPLGIEETLKHFKVSVQIFSSSELAPSTSNNPNGKLIFNKKGESFIANLEKKDFAPTLPIIIRIPSQMEHFKAQTSENYFYINQTIPTKTQLKNKPNKITILWDSSYSQQYRNTAIEMELLENYFSYLGNVAVQLVVFSTAIHQIKDFSILNGDWSTLKKYLSSVVYDGGTNYLQLKSLKATGKETLLFSDGLANLGSFYKFNNKPIYTINSKVSANHERLEEIANKTGGNYINLLRLSIPYATKVLKSEPYQFLGIKNASYTSEVFPKGPTTIKGDFSIAGVFDNNSSITLQFGYGGKVTEEKTIQISHNSSQNKLIKRLWAKLKLQELNKNKIENKNQIIALAKANHLVTDFTSMLILDRIEDYVKYKIEPPSELLTQYKEMLAASKEAEKERLEIIEERKLDIESDCEDLLEWYNKSFPKRSRPSKTRTRVTTNNTESQNTNSENNTINPSQDIADTDDQNTTTNETMIESEPIDPNTPYITGTIVDELGVPLPGANILVKGTTRGTQSDFDGNFSIQANDDELLEFSYVGFQSTVRRANDINNETLEMLPGSQLEEVVITGYSRRQTTAVGYAVSSVQSESVETSIDQLLQGKVAGININEENGQSGSSASVKIRGVSTVIGSPLYIIDGIFIEDDSSPNITTEDIESITILKSEDASKLYGAKGVNGVIVIRTKKGMEEKKDEIEALDAKINEVATLKSWDASSPYLNILEKEPTVEKAYQKYLEIRVDYSNTPTFYIDVADFFAEKKSIENSLKVLTNLIEIDLDNPELLKALAYKLEYFNQNNLAEEVYQKILELRPEYFQSYRDLALIYEANGAYQKSYDLLYKIYSGELAEKDEEERFYGIELIAYVELCRLVNKYGNKLSISKAEKDVFKEMPMDIRIVIDWNHDDTDIDLWVTDPKKEKAYYGNSLTDLGGRISEDMTDGFGPEEYLLKKARKGEYNIEVDYFADNYQKISGPTILKVTMYKNYGKKNETKKLIITRLDKEQDEILIGNLQFDN